MKSNQSNSKFQEVKHEWEEWMESEAFSFMDENLRNGKKLIYIQKYLTGDSYFSATFLLRDAIIYKLVKLPVPHNIDVLEATIEVANKLYNPNLPTAIRAKEDNGLALCESIDKLEALIAKACAITLTEPDLPSKEPLLEGINDLYEKLQYTKGRFEEMYQKAAICAVICCLLIDEVEKGLQFLTFWKNYGKYRKHAQMLKAICQELIKSNNTSINQMPAKIVEKFFEIYNGYRHPIYKQCLLALDAHPVLGKHVIINYLLTWMYLKVFKGRVKTTWDEMRLLMMS